MALNIVPFEGPKAPDWTDPKAPAAPSPSPNGEQEQASLEDSDAHLLLLSSSKEMTKRAKLKKLDIL
ncbi:MAG: hypothetical protein CME70_15935 [Halobacteriovorax sp.]|nr:hypothetical protein [Halobacteriovorax sp.]|tara:strand:- start:54196 stop:54396 length:201 start_codon:yes stop_codon:yes gene_type:complete